MSSNLRAWRGCDAEDEGGTCSHMQKAQEEIDSGRDR